MKAFTLFLFFSIVVGAGIGESAQGLSVEDPAETLLIAGTPTETGRSRVSLDGSLNLRRATGKAMTYRGDVTVVGPTGEGLARFNTWMELRLRHRGGEWTGRFQSGYSHESRLTGTLSLVETSGTDSLVLRGPVHEWVCHS